MRFFAKLVPQKFSISVLVSYALVLQALKETLIRHDFTFESDTDTEVIPKLAKFVFDKANEEGWYTMKTKSVILPVDFIVSLLHLNISSDIYWMTLNGLNCNFLKINLLLDVYIEA